jgi:hypothetical protein
MTSETACLYTGQAPFYRPPLRGVEDFNTTAASAHETDSLTRARRSGKEMR